MNELVNELNKALNDETNTIYRVEIFKHSTYNIVNVVVLMGYKSSVSTLVLTYVNNDLFKMNGKVKYHDLKIIDSIIKKVIRC